MSRALELTVYGTVPRPHVHIHWTPTRLTNHVVMARHFRTLQLKDCPADILLYLLGYLGLVDAVHLLSTCTSIRRLSENRSLWIQLLRRTQSDGSQQLACPLHTDLVQLSLSNLQQIARHTARLEKNWSRANMFPTGAVNILQCRGIRGLIAILAVIPGTNTLILHNTGQIFCHDLATMTYWPPEPVGEISGHVQFSGRGKHFIAVFHESEEEHMSDVLEVFCVTYGPGAVQTLQSVYYKRPFSFHIHFLDVFMQDAIVGMVYGDISTAEIYLIAFDMVTDASITILLPNVMIWPTYPYCSCLVQGSSVHIALRQLETCLCRVFVCDISPPWDSSNTDGRFNPSPRATYELMEGLHEFTRYPTTCQTLHPVGLTTLDTIIPHTNEQLATINILFQSDIFTSIDPSNTCRLVIPGEPREHDPDVFFTHSGNCLLLCVSCATQDDTLENSDPELHIVQFVKGPPAAFQIRRLEIPVRIQLELEMDKIHSMAFDDHLGVLYLTNTRGLIYAVPFA